MSLFYQLIQVILKRYLHDVKMNNIDSPGALNGHQWFPHCISKLDDSKEYFLVLLGLQSLRLKTLITSLISF